MSGKKFFFATTILLPTLLVSSTAFGWYGGVHATLCQITFDDPVLQPFLSSIDQGAIEGYGSEPPGGWHTQQWNDIDSRAYIGTAGAPNGNDWNSLDATTRLKYLQHNTTDVSVPMGHSPAGLDPDGFRSNGREKWLEAQTALWDSWPSVVGTASYTHSQTGHTYNFTGTINQVVNTFYDACRDNMTWSKNNLADSSYFLDYNDFKRAGWNGMTIGLMLQRAVFVDYFLGRQLPVATAPNYLGSTTGSPNIPSTIHFDMSGSYDPDRIVWNSNGTYSNTWDGIQIYGWDFNNDGAWDWASPNPTIDLSAWHLLYGSGLGLQPNQWLTYRTCAIDWEGNWGFAYGSLYLWNGGGVPEPATLSLLAVGGLALLRRKK